MEDGWEGECARITVPRGVGYPAGNAYLCGVSDLKGLWIYGNDKILEGGRSGRNAVGGGDRRCLRGEYLHLGA